ncbi:MAG: murein biosynthesis integral membrane protein MurJ [Gammaproteobacteria bacterium]
MDSQFLANTAVVGVATIMVYTIHALKDLCLAAYFGTGTEIEAFMIAYLLPTFVINTVVNALPSALIPVFAQIKERQGLQSGLQLLSATFVVTGVLLSLLTLILAIIHPFPVALLGSGFSPEKLALTESIYIRLLPLIVLQGLCSTIGAFLNTFNRFAAAAMLPALPSLAILVTLVTIGNAVTIGYLVWASVAGVVLQLFFLLTASARAKIWVTPIAHPALRDVARHYWPLLAGIALMAGNTVVDNAMAASLDPGNVAALGYGDRVITVILSIGGTAIGTVALPHFSRQIARGEWNDLRIVLQSHCTAIIIFSILFLLLFIPYSDEVTRLLWQRGAFSSSDTKTVSVIQICYSIRLPFYLIGILLVRTLSGMGLNRILFAISIMNFLLNAALNLLLLNIWGVYGLALSTSAVYATSTAFLVVAVTKHWPIASPSVGACTATRTP